MSHQYIGNKQTDAFLADYGISIKFEKVYYDSDFEGMEGFLEELVKEEYLTKCEDTEPLKPKGKGSFESGKSYPSGRFINNFGGEFQSLVDTSTFWVANEWICTISVPQTYELRAYSKNEKMIKDGVTYKAKDTTSETFILEEWDII